jgi:transposase-like protein
MTESAEIVEIKEKRPVGRPSLYDPAFVDQVIELGKIGKSTEAIGATLGVGTATLYRWRDEFPEFREALDTAKEYELLWWEDIAQTHMIENRESDKINASIWSRSMAARFPKKYRESTKTEITGADGAPLISGIQVTFVQPNE